MKQGRYGLIYKFFKSQIQFGYYRSGDCLPSIELLHEVYRVAVRTARNAYLQLEEEGYISLSPGRKTVVTYSAPPEAGIANTQDYFLARRETFRAMGQLLRALLVPLLREGSRRLQKHNMQQIKETALALEDGGFYISYFCGREMLLALDNQLLLDLYHEIVSYYQFVHTLPRIIHMERENRRYRQLARQTVEACEGGDRGELFSIYLQIQWLLDGTVFSYIEQAAKERPAPPEQVPFEWRVYRERPQLCYSLSSQLIWRILVGQQLSPGDRLPSYGAMAEKYGVSFSTIRRTVAMLERLGLVFASQGAGTRVTPPGEQEIDLRHKSVKKIASMFLEAVQIVRLSFDQVFLLLYPQALPDVGPCVAKLKRQQARGGALQPFFICIEYLLEGCGNQPLKEIWGKLCEVLLLGLPLLEAHAGALPECTLMRAEAEGIIRGVQERDRRQLHDGLRQLVLLAAPAMERLFPPDGPESARTRPCPDSISSNVI